VSRRERQRAEIMAAVRDGELARVLVLCREHLAEFPDDREVEDAAERAASRLEGNGDDRSGAG
jgi:hypothetical protein